LKGEGRLYFEVPYYFETQNSATTFTFQPSTCYCKQSVKAMSIFSPFPGYGVIIV